MFTSWEDASLEYAGRMAASLPYVLITVGFYLHYHHLNKPYETFLNLSVGVFSIIIAWFLGKQFDKARYLLKVLAYNNTILLENECQLLQQQEQLELVIDNVNASIWHLDLSTNRVIVSKGTECLYGYSKKEFKQEPMLWKKVVHPDDKTIIESSEKELFEGNITSREYRIIQKDGETKWVRGIIKPLVDSSGEITNLIGMTIDINDQKITGESIKYLAYYDQLTDLPNRNYLFTCFCEKLEECKQQNLQLAILFMDLDSFKMVNDTMGYLAGDHFLQEVAKRLKSCVGEQDLLARLGGDEFIVLMNAADREQVELAVQRIQDVISSFILLKKEKIYSSISIGISLFPNDGEDIQQLLRKADQAMYSAKKQGKNNFQFYTTALDAVHQRKMDLEMGLRTAIEKNELFLQYQPQVELETGEIKGAEALLRWHHPKFGNVSPVEFISIAEESGVILHVGKWVLQTACKQIKRWQERGIFIKVSVNVSPLQFKDKQFVEILKQTLLENQLSPEFLAIEITESVMQNVKESSIILNELKKLGIKIAMDDFGTGYSSLSVLSRLPIDYVKIDRSFVKDVITNTTVATLVRTIINMGNNLNFQLIAEGIETKEQAAFIFKNGCRFGQGYYYSRPIPAEDLEALFHKQDPTIRII
ncbi:EAL domain-containing protein [Bacillus sp. BRMEA1]|uniref:bifunctional diguanylate cyclase/phosphodiesterase n=1 Tax=Neobacillus endophyticus TaxID=2738405 RepID=UPI0015658C92|nr:GGDEF domain-containing phosphodiesterase [Neobacillus endophyticus]NRD76907.1 EAL domain-containing protein [Neobacillus endophyticus]